MKKTTLIIPVFALVVCLAPLPAFASELTVQESDGNSPFTVLGDETHNRIFIGNTSNGVINQSDHDVEAVTGSPSSSTGLLYLGYSSGVSGTYNLSGGSLSSSRYGYVGYYGTGLFDQTGGEVDISNLRIGFKANSSGTYNLENGEITTEHTTIGFQGVGLFEQRGGTHNTVNMSLATFGNSSGTYNLFDGDLTVSSGLDIGRSNTGNFSQSGGALTTGFLYLGKGGNYSISGGSLTVDYDIELGYSATATDSDFEIKNADAQVMVGRKLVFGNNPMSYSAVPGSVIHMTGSAFENQNTDPSALAGLGNTTFIFEGGAADQDPFEVGGQDMGLVPGGFDLNFSLDTLKIGGSDIGRLQLVDLFDNQPGWEGSEALYVKNLVLEAGSLLDLNGLNLYTLNFTDNGGTLLSGTGLHVAPEPVSTVLFLAGGAVFGLAGVRRKKRFQLH